MRNLTFMTVVFYAAISTVLGGIITLIVHITNVYIFKRAIRIDKVFFWLTVLLLFVFILLVVTEKQMEGGR